MKLKTINQYKNRKILSYKVTEDLNFEEIKALIDHSIKNNIYFTIHIDDFTTEQIGELVKLIGKDLSF